MPIDPNIPLGVQTPKPFDPIAEYGNVLALKGAIQGQQLQGVQLQNAQLQNKELQQNVADDQNFRNMYAQSIKSGTQASDDQIMQTLGPTKGQAFLKARLAAQQTRAQMQELQDKHSVAEADYAGGLAAALKATIDPKTGVVDPTALGSAIAQAHRDQYENEAQQLSQFAQSNPQALPGILDQMIQRSPKQRELMASEGRAAGPQATATATYQKMIANAYKDVKNADDLNAANLELTRVLPAKYANQLLTKYDPATIQAAVNQTITPAEQSKNNLEKADVAAKRATRRGELFGPVGNQADWDKALAQYLAEGGSPQDVPAQFSPQQAKLFANQAKTPHERVEESQGATRIGIDQQNANTNAGRLNVEQNKQSFDQGAIQRTAQALANGDLTRLKDVSSLRNDQRLQIFDLAKQYNPNFNTAEVDRKIKNEDYYANGAGAKNLQSFGTFLEHAGNASQAVNSYRNTGSPLINKSLNWFKKNAAGDPGYQSFIASLEPVRKEFEGFMLGGRALYGDDRKAAETILSDDSSMAQAQAALKTMGHTAQARFNEENFRYKKVSGHDLVDPFSPEALAGAKAVGVNLGGSQPSQAGQPTNTQPAQGVQPAPQPASNPVQGFKLQATGRGNQRIGSNDGRTWFDLRTGRKVQ